MPDKNLEAAQATLDQLQNVGGNAYAQNAPVLIAEAALDVALAQAKTDRIRILWDLMTTPEAGISNEMYARLSNEFAALLVQITASENES
jgi:hypothetical protein